MQTLSSRISVTSRTRWSSQRDGPGSEARARKVLEILGDLDLATLSTRHLEALVAELKAREYAPATINRHLAALSAVVSDARDDGLKVGAFRMLRQPEPPGRYRWLAPEEVQELAAAVGAVRVDWGHLITFLGETGLRPSEALSLEWADVDLERRHVTAWKTKTDRPRTVPLTRAALAAVQGQLEHATGPWHGDCLRSIQRAVQAARWKTSMAGDRSVTLYTLRHSAATRLVEAGVHIRTVSEWLGHSSMRVTQRYAHVSDTLLEDARDALEAQDQRRRAIR